MPAMLLHQSLTVWRTGEKERSHIVQLFNISQWYHVFIQKKKNIKQMFWWCVWYIILFILYIVCQNHYPHTHAAVTSQHNIQHKDSEFSWTSFISDLLLFSMDLCSSLKVCVLTVSRDCSFCFWLSCQSSILH